MTKPKHDTSIIDQARNLEFPEGVSGIAFHVTMNEDNYIDGCLFTLLGHVRKIGNDQEIMTMLIARGVLQWLSEEVIDDWETAAVFAKRGFDAIEKESTRFLNAADEGMSDETARLLDGCLSKLAATLDRQIFGRKEKADAGKQDDADADNAH